MDVPGFSKVGQLLEDEEDERRRNVEAAAVLYAKAQDAFNGQGSKDEVLQLFERAESSMKEMFGSGLAGLAPKELEMVLKGRLHMAVIVAQMPEHVGQWSKVRSLVEDVLQFDFNNCHARWLRGLALLHGCAGVGGAASGQRSKAQEEMHLAVKCARASGKVAEAVQWEAEIEKTFPKASEESELPADGAGAPAAAAQPHASEEATPGAAAAAAPAPSSARDRSPGPALQRGFFNRPRAAARTRSSGPPAAQEIAGRATAALRPETASAGAATAAAAAGAPAAPVATASALEDKEQELRDLRDAAAAASAEAERRHSREMEQLRAELREAQQGRQEALEDGRLQRERAGLSRQQLGELEAELEQALLAPSAASRPAGGAAQGDDSADQAELGELRAAVQELAEGLRAGSAWAEAEHRQYTDCATEVCTIREMATRELRERQTASKQFIADIKGLGQKMGELKAASKVLRDNVRKLGGRGEANDGAAVDLPRLVGDAEQFKRLPRETKLRALLDDATVLWLLALAFVVGALVAVAIPVEAFGVLHCRFVCAR